MRWAFRLIFPLLVVLLFGQCRSNAAQERRLKATLRDLVGDDHRSTLNTSKTHLLAETINPDSSGHTRYAVVSLKKNTVVLKGVYNKGGYARWANDRSVKVLSIPGHVNKVPDSTVYIQTISIDYQPR